MQSARCQGLGLREPSPCSLGLNGVREREAQMYNCRLFCLLFLNGVETVSRKLQEKRSSANRLRLSQFCERPCRFSASPPWGIDGAAVRVQSYQPIVPTSLCQSQQQLPHPFYEQTPSWAGSLSVLGGPGQILQPGPNCSL